MVLEIEELELEEEVGDSKEQKLETLIQKFANYEVKGDFLVYQIYFYDPLEDM